MISGQLLLLLSAVRSSWHKLAVTAVISVDRFRMFPIVSTVLFASIPRWCFWSTVVPGPWTASGCKPLMYAQQSKSFACDLMFELPSKRMEPIFTTHCLWPIIGFAIVAMNLLADQRCMVALGICWKSTILKRIPPPHIVSFLISLQLLTARLARGTCPTRHVG